MTDPTRLLQSADSTDLEKELLRSWESERPSEGARDRALATLGLATVGAGAAASIAPKAASLGWTAIVKWLGLGFVALGAAGAGVSMLSHRHTEASVSGPHAPVQVAAPKASAELTAAAATQVDPIEPAPAPTTPSVPRPVTRSARPASSSLADQVAELDRARAALDAGDTARTLRIVDAYAAAYPGGALTQEAELLRVDALVRGGNRTEAERTGKHFLAAYPKSPHAARVRALLGYAP